jgi:hypothetical protein
MVIVPFTSDYSQTFRTQLGSDTYVFDARWNERGQAWDFDLTRNSDQVLLLTGVPLLSGQDVLAPYALGIGGMVVADLSSTNSDAGPDDFGDRVVVVHFSPEEMAILAGAGVAGIAPTGGAPAAASTSTNSQTSTGGTGSSTQVVTTTISQTITNLTLVGGGGGIGSDQERSDSSGSEVLAYQFPVNAGLNLNATLKAIASFIAEGSGTIRVYVGGTPGAIGDTGVPSGTLVGSAAVSGLSLPFISGAPVANPGGMTLVKVTIQSSAPATSVQIDTVNGALG